MSAASRSESESSVTVFVSHRVTPGSEDDFREWQERVTAVERTFPGFLGAELFDPVPGVQDDWTIMYEFDSTPHLEAWMNSPRRAELLAEAEEFKDFAVHRMASPFGAWIPAGEGGEPASWKTAMSVLVGLYPTVVILTVVLNDLWESAPLWSSLLVGNIASVALLTWVVMPTVTRVLGFWLAPRENARPHTDLIGTGVSLLFLGCVAALFAWLT
ncbi:antibiotic biosynthesis monooxygenase [Rhodococcus sp. NPDC058521]|uniref:antibiotic biosynthesis monooxygenase n=1 Tax=Rhodococcus sp. NPDC058521 TaxID=3346536 RepID=UPI00364EA854